MGTLKSALTVIGVVILVALWTAVFTVDERQKALVLRFGEINRIIETPGLYFKFPVADDVIYIEDRALVWESNDKRVQVIDGRRYLVDTVTIVRISNAQRFRETAGADLTLARQRIETRLDAALRQTYGRRTFDAALSKDRAVMMAEIRDQVAGEARTLGIDIMDVRIRRTDLMQDVLEDTYNRMSSERKAEATDLRSKGEATKTRMFAEADRTYTEKISQARREAEIIRGEGDAERNRIYAEAFEKDPEFFAFYRSLQAYATSLGSQGTTLVLKPDSEFFKYFGTRPRAAGDPATPELPVATPQ
jgi:membrane protease subunit HflC